MCNLVIDIGNTTNKLAIFKSRELVHYQRFKEIDYNDLTRLIEKYTIKNATVSSVNTDDAELVDYLKRAVTYFPFSTTIVGEIINNYKSLSTLGLDRWAKIIAAQSLFKGKNCLMIDLGTCITYDVLTAKSEYFGGSISLGIRMRFAALNHYTGRLPLVQWDKQETNIPIGDNTINAITSGVLQGVLNEVLGFIAIENKKYKDLQVFITGGDGDFLNMQLKNSIFAAQITYEPYLVLKGLNEVITL